MSNGKAAAPVTVLMAVYNDSKYLPPAMESILRQSYADFRFLIVDDCSTDDTPALLDRYKDSRIDRLRLSRNVGQTAALNVGLKEASSPWIARMDADDFSAPERLQRQMQALAEDSGLSCVGTGIWEFREDPSKMEVVKVRPEGHEAIKRAALHGSGMIHGSIVVSRKALLQIGGYDERYRYAADRDLFIRLFAGHRGRNLQEPLLGVRRSGDQDSFSLTAADEYIQIFERLLAHPNGFSAEERQIIRQSLAWSYLFRSWYFRERKQMAGWFRDQKRAWSVSPASAFRNLANSGARRLLPGKVQAGLKKALGGGERATFRTR